VNYKGTKIVCDALFPLLRPHARVVNVASQLGKLGFIQDKHMYERLLSADLSVNEIDDFIDQYLQYI
jgi:carbonyl reductase 1